MALTADELLARIAAAHPANEDEVETKILLHLFALLGYSDEDRADQVPVVFTRGRQRERKRADFVLYQGSERAYANALVTVEAKKLDEDLADAEEQARSYAAALGTPLYIACNGTIVVAARFAPGTETAPVIRMALKDLPGKVADLHSLVGRRSAILLKERLEYLAAYVPKLEELPPNQFFRFYLERLRDRFQAFAFAGEVLKPPEHDPVPPRLPVHVKVGNDNSHLDHILLAQRLQVGPTRIFIQGDPGSGKTTLCRRVTGVLAAQALTAATDSIPIFVSLSRGVPGTVLEALGRACTDLGLRSLPSLYEAALRSSRVVLVFDGLDEMPREPVAQARLVELLQHASWTSALVTSRPQGFKTGKFGVTSRRFEYGRVLPLSNDEIHDILQTYLIDPVTVSAIWEKYRAHVLPDLSSPILLLMCIRLARETSKWDKLSLLSLYERYVGVLHAFFNARTVRGRDAQVPVGDVLDCLAEAAVLIRERSWGRSPLSVDGLQTALLSKKNIAEVDSLFNTGMILSVAGEARFVHLTFEEYGLARAMIRAVEAGDPAAGFVIAGISDATYRIAHSGLNPKTEATLIGWFRDKSRQVRKRAVGILKHGVSDQGAEKLWAEFVDGSETFKLQLLRMLVVRSDQRAIDWLLKHGARYERSLFEGIASLGRVELLPILFDAIPTHGFSAFHCALAGVLRCSASEFLPRLQEAYAASSSRTRASVSRILSQHAESPLSARVLDTFILNEQKPDSLMRHLGLAVAVGIPVSTEAVLHLIAVLKREGRYEGRAAKTASNIARQIEWELAPGSGDWTALANELRRIGSPTPATE